jgi:hypothetical protein
MPDPGNKCQHSLKDLKSCMLGNVSGDWMQTMIYEVLAAFIGERGSDILCGKF